MRYFLTGGSGYVGFSLLKKLSESGHEIVALVRNPQNSEFMQLPGVTLVKGDVTDPEIVKSAMAGCDGVFHLAAHAKVWDKDPGNFDRINVQGTVHVLQAALENHIPKVVHCSSAGVHGPSVDGMITEKSSRKTEYYNPYDRTKAEAFDVAIQFAQKGLNVTIVSPTRIYGPIFHRKADAVTLLIQKFATENWRWVPGSGKQIGNYVFMDDVINGILLAMEKGRAGEEYLLGGENLSYDGFFQHMAEAGKIKRRLVHIPVFLLKIATYIQKLKPLFGAEPVMTPDWTAKIKLDWIIDIQKAKSELGYTVTPTAEAMRNTIEFFRQKTR